MALKDLIQQAKQSRLGKAISNLDRDKEREGFQFVSPQQRQTISQRNPFSNKNYQGSNLQRGIRGATDFFDRSSKFIENRPVLGAPARFTMGRGDAQRDLALSSAKDFYQGRPVRGAAKAVGLGLSLTPPGAAGLALSSGLGAATAEPGQRVRGAGQSSMYASIYQGGANLTNPFISAGLSKFAPGAGAVTQRVVPATANVVQGIGLDVASGQPTTAASIGLDVVTGLAGGRGQFGGNIKGITGNSRTVSNAIQNESAITKVINNYNTEKIMKDPIAGGDTIVEAQRLWRKLFGQKAEMPQSVDKIVGDLNDALSGAKTQKLMEREGYTLGLVGGEKATGYRDATKFSSMLDQKPRFEIDDSGAKLKDANKKLTALLDYNQQVGFGKLAPEKTLKLGEILDHEELFKNYPQFKDIEVRVGTTKGNAAGSYNPATNRIELSTSAIVDKGNKSTFLHEIQHAIQEIEGFARGGSPEQFEIDRMLKNWGVKSLDERDSLVKKLSNEKKSLEKDYAPLSDLFNKANKLFGERKISGNEYKKLLLEFDNKNKSINQKYGFNVSNRLKDIDSEINKLSTIEKSPFSDFGGYQRLSGELEARAVQRRMDLTPEQRLSTDPYSAEAIATTGRTDPSDFITRFDGGRMADIPNEVKKIIDPIAKRNSDGSYTFGYTRNNEGAEGFGKRFGQDIEPSGRYMNIGSIEERLKRGKMLSEGNPNMEYGEVTFNNPLFINWGDGYQSGKNWKNVLSDKYGGKTGRELSQAIANDGYDAIITYELRPDDPRYIRGGFESEAVDLTSFKPTNTMASIDQVELKPKTRLQNQISDLEAKGYSELEANRQVAQIAQEQRSNFSSDGIKDINRVKAMARSKAFLEGDIETLRKKNPSLVDRVVESVREALGDERMSDEDALQYALELPNKGQTTVTTPEPLIKARELKQKAREVRNLVFNSETDLEVKQKAIKENLDTLNREALSDFREWEKQLAKQEKLKTARGQTTRNVNQILTTIKEQSVPDYIKHKKINDLKDISPIDIGLKDVNRNFETVFGKNSEAEKRLLRPFDTSKSKMIDDLESLADDLDKNIVQKYGFKKGSKESAAIQQYGERNRDYASLVDEFGESKAKDIVEANRWFRSKYDQLLDDVNSVRQRIYPNQPDKIIPRRNDYYRHFVEMQEGFAGLRNLFETPANISPSLAGISSDTKPKSKWLSFAQQRLGNKTTEDAIGGFLEYSKAQTYAKHIDPHTAQFRDFTQQLRDQMESYRGDTGKLNNFIEFMDDFTNDLAGKTNPADRALQKYIGRKPFAVLNWINNRTKANVILGNLSSSIAQFFNIPQGVAEAGPINSIKGINRSFAGLLQDNPAIKESEFIKTRYGDSTLDRFDTGLLANTKKLAGWITGIGDEIGTKYIWNSLYEKGLAQGVENPVKYADDLTRKMVAGRGIGEVPVLQKAKTFQLIAPFQLEVANIWHVMNDWAGEKAAGKFVTFFVASHIMNKMAAEIRGSDVSLDPIQATIDAYNAFQEEDDKRIGAIRAGGRLGGEFLSNVPLGQTVASIYPEYGFKVGDTQLPTRSDLFGEGDPTRYGSGLLAAKGLQDPLFKLVPGFGGQQIKRTLEGVQSVMGGASESRSGRIRTPIEQNAENYIRGALFGQYSIPEVRDYFDDNKSVLGEKQTENFKQILTQQGPEAAKNYYDSIMSKRTLQSEKASIKSKIEAGQDVDTSKLPTKEAIDLIKTKIEAGIDVSPQELETAYLNNVIQMPSSNRYEKGQRDSKLWSKTGEILDNEDLSEAQKQVLIGKVAQELGVTEQEVQTYQVAKENNDSKTLYVLDEIDRIQDPQQLLSMLTSGRKPVNGKILISDGVIDNLVDDGIIPEQLGKDLKNLDFNADGTLKQKKSKKGGGGRSKKSARDKAFERYLANLAKITLPSGKIRTQAPMRINVKGLTFSD